MFHAFHRVGPRPIRRQLLKAMSRALAPGGIAHLQLPFYPDRTPQTVPAPHSAWADDPNRNELASAEGEVWVTPADLPELYADVGEWLCDVRLQVIDFPKATRRFDDGRERLAHIVVSGSARPTLATRVYGVAP
jgi:SAM-dependent methyltransferase